MLHFDVSVFPELRTERLRLREFRSDDASALHALRSDPAVMQHIARPPSASVEAARALIATMHADRLAANSVPWAIELVHDGTFIGSVGFWRMNKEHHRGEIGYMLHRAHWGRGYASEALQAAVDHGFSVLGFHSIEGVIDPVNRASRRVLEKAGFVQEAHFKENWHFEGRFLDSVVLSRLAP